MNIRYIPYEQARTLAGPWAKNVGHHPRSVFLGAFLAGKLVGAVGWLKRGEVLEYNSAIILPEYRKKGIYSLLFQAREMETARIPHEKTVAYCTDYSLGMLLSHGFEITKKYKCSTKVERYELQRRNNERGAERHR